MASIIRKIRPWLVIVIGFILFWPFLISHFFMSAANLPQFWITVILMFNLIGIPAFLLLWGPLILLSAKNSTRHWSCYLVVIVAMAVTAGGLTTLYLDQHLIWPILLLWFSS